MLRFSTAGAATVSLYYLLLAFLTEVLGFWYLTSSIAAFLIGYATNFTLQKLWTFKERSTHALSRQVTLHLALQFGNLVLNTTLLYLLVEYGQLWYITAQLILTVALSIESYFVSRWIFASVSR